MQKKTLNDIAEVISGLSYRRYLDDDGKNFRVIVQRSIKRDGVLSDFEEIKLINETTIYCTAGTKTQQQTEEKYIKTCFFHRLPPSGRATTTVSYRV